MSFLFLISLLLGEFIQKILDPCINYDYKSYLLCIEFVQNELDPCWEVYHTPKIKTFIQKDSLFWSIIALEACAMQK